MLLRKSPGVSQQHSAATPLSNDLVMGVVQHSYSLVGKRHLFVPVCRLSLSFFFLPLSLSIAHSTLYAFLTVFLSFFLSFQETNDSHKLVAAGCKPAAPPGLVINVAGSSGVGGRLSRRRSVRAPLGWVLCMMSQRELKFCFVGGGGGGCLWRRV